MEFFNGRNSMSPLLLLLILFTLLGNILSKHHIRHHRDRFKRQQGAHLYLPGTFVTSEGEGPDNGPWSSWSEPSPCSRTCGGGVSTQQRQCHYGYECQGPSRKHFSCNTQDCPDLSDFRSHQCSEYDRIPFEGVYYQWIPYTKAPNPCELNCMPRGERFYYRHKTYVVDGTRCNDENLNVCVEGVCQPVGCDMMLGSNTVEDPCRQCGGDGSMCNTVSDVLNMQDLQVGYNDILLIPGGATNIRVKESGPSNNYLAVRNTSGYYYLNGNWRIDFPRTLDFAGCRFHYDRSPRGFSAPDSITCLGPTYEPLFIVLLYQDVNVGVEYTYSVPIGILPGDGTETYAWTFDAFSPCSATCGGGVQYRNVSCAGRRTLELADRSLCDVNNEPPTAQRCNDQPCDPRWAVKQWGRCSSNCGNSGVQLRQVYCEQIIANGIASIVDDQYCINVQKPISEQPCNQGLICSEWHIGPWKPCDHLCGDGYQSRKVTCFKKTNGRIEVLDESYCEQKPETQQLCNLRPCDGVDWVTSEWTGCENNCGLANETRRAICSSTKGEIFADDLCADLPVPVLVRQCKSTDSACNFQWYSSQWSECSAKCGSGVQTRKVFCGNPIATGIKIVDDSKCNPQKKEESIMPCTADKKQCKGEWFTGPWSQCSKECGSGEQTRKVICLRDNETVSANECDPETIAFSSGECNTQICPPEVTTVSESPDEKGSTELPGEISVSTPAEGTSDEDYKYVEEYDETCDDGEWVDEDESVTPQSPTPTDDSMSALNDEPMFGDDPEAGLGNELDTGSGNGQLSTDSIWSTSEGSGDYSTDLSSDSTIEMSEITTVGSASKPVISTVAQVPFIGESNFGADEPTTKSSATSTSNSDLSESTDVSATTDASAGTEPSDITDATDITDSSSDVTDPSADTDASDITDASAVTDSSDVTDASADTDATDVTDASAVTDASSETDASADTDATDVTDASAVTDASSEMEASDVTDASAATDASSETDASADTDATDATDASAVTDASSETQASDVTDATDVTDLTSATDSSAETDGASDSVTTDSSGATDASTSSDEGLSGSTEESASESTDITTDVSGISDASEISTLSTEEGTDLSTNEDSTESTIEGSSQVTGLSSELSSESSQSSEEVSEGSTISSLSSEGTSEISTIDSSEESSASGGSSEMTTEESSSVSSDISSTIESSDVTSASTEEISGSSDSSFGSSTESSSDGITELTSELSSEVSGSSESTVEFSTEESETEESGLSSESTSPGSSESSIESSTEIGSSEESSSQLTSESSSELTSESSTDLSSDLSSSTSDFTESSDLSSVSEISGSTDTESSSEYDIWASSTEYYSSSEFSTWDFSTITDLFIPKKLRKCRRRVKKTCKDSKFGCCIDKITPAKGPFNKGCPITTTCNETQFGCCEDNVSVAKGKNFEGCPTSQCKESLFGCCPDNKTEAEGVDNEGCPEPPPKCQKSKFGCCEDNDTEAKGPNLEGCFEESTSEATSEATSESSSEGTSEATSEETTGSDSDLDTATEISTTEGMRSCDTSPNGCCPDGENSPTGEDFEGCPNIFKDNCNESYFKCCPDRVTSAKGPNYKGCKMPCEENQYGCCPDGVTPAHGANREGCCLDTQFGCCPDNIRPAQGSNLEGCGCEYSSYRCCPDNVTAALGHYNEGCGCQYSPNGCCPDDVTTAQGPQYQGCSCETFQFGCCADGVTPAKGPFRQDCECKNTEFGCCSDEKTAAKGPNNTGCTCETTKYGCCLDGVYEAKGDNFEGCEELPLNLQTSCSLPKERGSCRNYTVKWFFDLDYGGCSRFWYGGCDGNNNRFKSQDDCNAVCVEPSGRERCALPKVTGACEGYYPKWYYDTERQACSQFVYSGCLGNNNKFETREECMELCGEVSGAETCDQPKEEGPCRGNFVRWYFDKTSGRCSQFVYGGCKGNNNNFATESACRQQCTEPGRQRDYCSLLKAEGNCTGRDPRWHYNPSETRCMPFYYSGCNGNNNNFVSQQACEADCPKMIVKDVCHLPAETGECGNYVFRWYYDTSDKRCQQFYYGGCGGNGNNFDSETDCEQRCVNLVPATTAPPPPPPTQPTPLIPVGRPTPSTTFTTENCYLDSDTGPCRTYEARWYYDRQDGSCKQFMYGGCPGNGNNFKTVEECHDSCAAIQDLCSLPVTVGPCNGEYEQWYFNKASGSCETFKYGGCLGNDNRFEDQMSCERRCRERQPETTTLAMPARVTAPPPPPPVDASVCYTPVDAGNCNESIASYYFDPNTQRCAAFIYTGCNGNANRYTSEEQCERQCGQFRGQDVCNLQRDPGLCNGYIRKYYYDAVAGRCGQFAYTGCQGNGNRFSSQEECEYVCVTHEEKRPPATNETASVICRLPLDVGQCEGGNHKQYYFDDSRGECTAFIYSGCGGNFNNFKTFQACIDLCKEFLVKTEPTIIDPIDPSKGEHPCQKYLDDCAIMRCEYGVEAYVDEETLCTKCRCEDPCRQLTCDEKSKCAVDINRNRTTYDDPTYVAVCRLVNKDGDCPYISGSENRCDRECDNDADCAMALKCCSTGCGTSCVLPEILVPQPLLTSSLLPAFTPTPVQIGHFPPRVDENIFKPEVVAGEGGLATLTCAVQGNPTPSITWKRGHLFIDGTQPRYRLLLDGALQIITLHKTDSGIYLCAADNGLGPPIERSINLEVINSEPHSTSIVGDDENSQVVVALGAPTSLHCYAIGYPFPAVTWWKDDSMIPLRTSQFEVRKDYSLLIHSVQLSNLGVYTCQAYNGIGKAASWSVTVQALGPFESTKPEDQAYMKYIVNPPSRFTTIAPRNPIYPVDPNQGNPEPPIIPTHRPTIDPNSVYPNVSAEGHRVYQVPVKVNITQTQNRFSSGSDISIGCDVEGYPIPLVQWLKDQRPLVPSSVIQISESHRLYISNAQVGDSGEYRCEAANDYSRSASTINVVVESVFIHPNCTDNQFFANCQLIVRAQYCVHKYYARFCCKSCTEAGQLPSLGPHLELEDDNQNDLSNNVLRRK